jgi:hypothetical protein
LFVCSSVVHSFGAGGKEEEEGKMRREKSDDEGEKKQRKGLVGKNHTYRHFSISVVPSFRPTNETCPTMQTRFHHWDDPVVEI